MKPLVNRLNADLMIDLLVVVSGRYSEITGKEISDRKELAKVLLETFEGVLTEVDYQPYKKETVTGRARFENLLTSRMMSRAVHRGLFLATEKMQAKHGIAGGTDRIVLTVTGWQRYRELTRRGNLLTALKIAA